MAIKFFNDGSAFRLPRKRDTAAWVATCIEAEGCRAGDVTYVFCSRDKHVEMNRTYLGHDYPTDVITFGYGEDGEVGGDIFIDPETVAENAVLFGATRPDEMRRVLIHGVLHLCGYGDATEEEQRTMRLKEDECLARFGRDGK